MRLIRCDHHRRRTHAGEITRDACTQHDIIRGKRIRADLDADQRRGPTQFRRIFRTLPFRGRCTGSEGDGHTPVRPGRPSICSDHKRLPHRTRNQPSSATRLPPNLVGDFLEVRVVEPRFPQRFQDQLRSPLRFWRAGDTSSDGVGQGLQERDGPAAGQGCANNTLVELAGVCWGLLD